MPRLIAMILLLSAACATAPAATPTVEQAAVQPPDAPSVGPAAAVPAEATLVPPTAIPPTEVPAEAAAQTAQERPAWQTIALSDARTGAAFTLADFAGKTVFVEPMATWCPNCRSQQRQVIPVYQDLGQGEDYVFISLSVGENIDGATLAAYAEREGFGWTFAIASQELMVALAEVFGRGVLSPPSTPHFVIYPDGSTSDVSYGAESSDALRASLTSA
jgi:thiol-disulfide isomerase/thioredoxin